MAITFSGQKPGRRGARAGLLMHWRVIQRALRGHCDEQILSMGVILFVAFAFWLMEAHGIFAIFRAKTGTGVDALALLTPGTGLMGVLVALPVLAHATWQLYRRYTG
jgi:uncharacterized membrane protein